MMLPSSLPYGMMTAHVLMCSWVQEGRRQPPPPLDSSANSLVERAKRINDDLRSTAAPDEVERLYDDVLEFSLVPGSLGGATEEAIVEDHGADSPWRSPCSALAALASGSGALCSTGL